MEGLDKQERDEVFSKIVRAGKRTYFFDVKKTRKEDDFYLTITESKKRYVSDGEFKYEKHKIFLYKEDFEKFKEAILEATDFAQDAVNGDVEIPTGHTQVAGKDLPEEEEVEVGINQSLTDIDFEDLGK